MKKLTITIFASFIAVYILPLGVLPMVIPDETRYAEISREMLDSGDWIVPRLDGLRYFEKPVLGYWVHALSIKLFGENAFAIRLPSALTTGLSALLIFSLVRKFGGGRLIGLLASAVFLTCVEVFVVGVFCVLDGLFSLFVTAAIISFYFAYVTENAKEKKIYLALFGIGCGLAFLTKGFIAFTLPFVTIVPFLLWYRQINGLWKLVWIPILTAVLVTLPWSVMIYLRENDFWRYFFWEEHVRRFFSTDAQHAEPFWFFIPVLAGGALPWTAVLPVIVTGLKKTQRKDPFLRFALCWLIFPFLFFSISRGKLGTYILPCFPPVAILTTLGLTKYFVADKTKTFDAVVRSSAILIIIGACALVLIHTAAPAWSIYDKKETWKWVLLTFGLLSYAIFLALASRNTNYRIKISLCCIGFMCLMFSAHFITPNRLKTGKMPGEFITSHSKQIRPDTIIISDNYLTPAVCWFYKRDDVYMLDRAGEFTYGFSYDGTKHKLVALEEFAAFIKQNSKGREVVLITSEKRYKSYHKMLPNPANEVREYGFVMAEFASTITAEQTFTTRPAEK